MKNKHISLIPILATAFIAFAPSEARADGWYECQADQVLEQSNRVRVRCKNVLSINGNNVTFFAIDKTDATKASRFVSMASASVLSGQLFIVFAPDSSATNVSGCDAGNCRTPTTFGLRND